MSEGRFLDTGLYQEIYRPFDGRHQMSLMVPVAGEQWGFTLFRERAFSDDEAYLLAQLQGHVGRALAAANHASVSATCCGWWQSGNSGHWSLFPASGISAWIGSPAAAST